MLYNVQYVPSGSMSDALFFRCCLVQDVPVDLGEAADKVKAYVPVMLKVFLHQPQYDNSLQVEAEIYTKTVRRMLEENQTPCLVQPLAYLQCKQLVQACDPFYGDDLSNTQSMNSNECLLRNLTQQQHQGIKRALLNMKTTRVGDYPMTQAENLSSEQYFQQTQNDVDIMMTKRIIDPLPLGDWLLSEEGQRAPADTLRSILFQLFWTLECCHRNGLVHNDLHLNNVLLERLPQKEQWLFVIPPGKKGLYQRVRGGIGKTVTKLATKVPGVKESFFPEQFTKEGKDEGEEGGAADDAPFYFLVDVEYKVNMFDWDNSHVVPGSPDRIPPNTKLSDRECAVTGKCNAYNTNSDIFTLMCGLYGIYSSTKNATLQNLFNQIEKTNTRLYFGLKNSPSMYQRNQCSYYLTDIMIQRKSALLTKPPVDLTPASAEQMMLCPRPEQQSILMSLLTESPSIFPFQREMPPSAISSQRFQTYTLPKIPTYLKDQYVEIEIKDGKEEGCPYTPKTT